MADTQSILQLGIEAARSGDKAEARELFRLVTREDPNNGQGWLWLAGVAEDREEKRAALERVLQLDPSNDLARKGLAALGGAAGAAAVTSVPPAPATTAPPVVDASRTSAATGPASDQDIADAFDSIDDYTAAPESNRARVYDQQPQVGGYVPPDFGDEDYDLSEYQNRPAAAADVDRDPVVVVEDEEPRRRGIGLWLPALLVLLLALLAFFLIYRNTGNQTAGTDPGGIGGAATSTADALASDTGFGGAAPVTDTTTTGLLTDTTTAVLPGASAAASDAAASAPPAVEAPPTASDAAASAPPAVEASAPPAVEASAPPAVEASAPPAPANDVASANPGVVNNTDVLSAGTFSYGFSGLSNVATGNYGGAQPSRGRYLIVLATVQNTGGAPVQIADGFFVIKDAQGRVYDFNRAASVDYFNRYPGSGDYPADAQLQPGAPLGSMPLLFDVAPDATNLVMFSRENTAQGFLVRASAQ